MEGQCGAGAELGWLVTIAGTEPSVWKVGGVGAEPSFFTRGFWQASGWGRQRMHSLQGPDTGQNPEE